MKPLAARVREDVTVWLAHPKNGRIAETVLSAGEPVVVLKFLFDKEHGPRAIVVDGDGLIYACPTRSLEVVLERELRELLAEAALTNVPENKSRE